MASVPEVDRGLSQTSRKESRTSFWHEGRAPLEFIDLLTSPIWHDNTIPRGDRSATLVLPGFMESDFTSTVGLRTWAESLNYSTHAAGIPLFISPSLHRSRVEKAANEIYEREGEINIIGHSMGGVLAWDLAVRNPKIFRSVVAIASPLKVIKPSRPLDERISSLSIYTEDDGVVEWNSCIPEDPNTETKKIEDSTHLGLLYNEDAYRSIAEFLARVGEEVRKRVDRKILPFRVPVRSAA